MIRSWGCNFCNNSELKSWDVMNNSGALKGFTTRKRKSVCKLGIKNDDIETIGKATKCPKFCSNLGFDIGDYYAHTFFRLEEAKGQEELQVTYPNNDELKKLFDNNQDCLELVIMSDGDFPIGFDQPERHEDVMRISIPDFEQVEEWVKHWGVELRKRGWIE